MAREAGQRLFGVTALFADGKEYELSLTEGSFEGLQSSLSRDGFTLVRGDEGLKKWCNEKADGFESGEQEVLEKEDRNELGAIVRRLILAKEDEGHITHASNWELGNVILRKARLGNYTRNIHRDLDEISVANMQSIHGLHHYYNAWVPLAPVLSHPLALLLPHSLDQDDITSFLDYSPADRTGLRYNPDQRWIYFDHLTPGDAILWRSEQIFHTSFSLPSQLPSFHARRSIDIRVNFG